ncbi:MAG: CoA transferase [Chloroflexi bacterium]|nr:CoA transferase [Chloroflexota bacterium]
MKQPSPHGPLTGIRVLDFGMAAVGPIAAEYLGEMGADVIKVESPKGDMVRRGKPTMRGMAHTFLGNNLTKRGIVLDLKQDVDREIALKLIATADILIENFRSFEVMERLHLGYARLSEINPRLIYLQSSAFGPRGPMKGMVSNDWIAQASSGATSVTGQPGGLPEFSRGTASLDWVGAFVNLQAVLVALYVRERTGRGMMVQTSQFQSTAVAGTTRLAEYLATGVPPAPMGSARPNIVPDQAFATADGYITVSVPHDGVWRRLCRTLGREDLLNDPRFATNAGRVAHRDDLIPILDAIFRTGTTDDWVGRLRAAGVPAVRFQRGRTLSASLLNEPQVQAEHMMSVMDTPWGDMATAEPHWRFNKTPARITRPSPAQGQHQAEVLAELGIFEEAATRG